MNTSITMNKFDFFIHKYISDNMFLLLAYCYVIIQSLRIFSLFPSSRKYVYIVLIKLRPLSVLLKVRLNPSIFSIYKIMIYSREPPNTTVFIEAQETKNNNTARESDVIISDGVEKVCRILQFNLNFQNFEEYSSWFK